MHIPNHNKLHQRREELLYLVVLEKWSKFTTILQEVWAELKKRNGKASHEEDRETSLLWAVTAQLTFLSWSMKCQTRHEILQGTWPIIVSSLMTTCSGNCKRIFYIVNLFHTKNFTYIKGVQISLGYQSRYPNVVNPWKWHPMFNMVIKCMWLKTIGQWKKLLWIL